MAGPIYLHDGDAVSIGTGAAGNVGFNVSDPDEKLENNGNIKLTDPATQRVWTTQKVYNVLDYGADNTGTNACQTQIQQAIDDAANAGGGIVYFPKGTYRVTSGLTIGKAGDAQSNICLIGANRYAAILWGDNASAISILKIQGNTTTNAPSDFITVKELGFAKWESGSQGNHKAIEVTYGCRVVIENVFINGVHTGIHMEHHSNMIYHPWIQSCNTGIYLKNRVGDTSNGHRIIGGQIRRLSSGGYGIRVEGKSNSIRGVSIENDTTWVGNGTGISLESDGDHYVTGCYIESLATGININSSRNTIMGCYINENTTQINWASGSGSSDKNVLIGNTQRAAGDVFTQVDVFLSDRLGVGTPSPASDTKLDIRGDTDADARMQLKAATGYNAHSIIDGASGYDSSLLLRKAGANQWGVFRSGSDSDQLKIARYYSSSWNEVLAAKIDTGDIGINTNAPSEKLDVNGNARFRSVGSASNDNVPLYIETTGGSVGRLSTSSSDRRKKKDISTLKNSLEKVTKLRGVNFKWKGSKGKGRQIGMIAQEVEKVLPEVVFTNPTDGFKGIRYAELTAVLVEALKEQQAQITALSKNLSKQKRSKKSK